MERAPVDGGTGSQLNDLAEVHHRQPVTHVLYHRQIMGDKKVGEAELFLQVLEKINHLGLDGNIQG